jgi:hypothetical protein
MAGDWMKVELVTPDKPEVFQMAQILGIDPDAVVGKLIRVWGWFNSHTEDGESSAHIALHLNRMVSNEDFCKAMIEVGWLESDGEVIRIPKFDRHNSQGAKTRALANRRTAKRRSKEKAPDSGCNENVPLAPLQKHVPEKRREKKRRDTPVVDSIDPDAMEFSMETSK